MKRAGLSLTLIIAASAGVSDDFGRGSFQDDIGGAAETIKPTLACTSLADLVAVQAAQRNVDATTINYLLNASICYAFEAGTLFGFGDHSDGVVVGNFEYHVGTFDPFFLPEAHVKIW